MRKATGEAGDVGHRLSDVHVPTLTRLIDASVGHARANRLGTKMA